MSTISPVAVALPAGTWQADPVHSSVGFSARHMVVSTFRGGFREFGATVTVADDGAIRVAGSVRSASIDTRDENLTGHLLSPEFLDAEAHADITYVIDRISQRDGRVEATGQITVKGITRPVVATGVLTEATEDPWGNTRGGIELTTTIDRREFEMSWNTPLPTGGLAVGYEVELTLHLELVKDAS